MWTTPEHMKQWLGPRELEMISCEVDLRVGGGYRYVHRSPDGQEFGFHGKYLEIEEAVNTLTLKARDGGTLVTTHSRHSSTEARNGHLAGGMERGMSEGYERLEALVQKLGNAA